MDNLTHSINHLVIGTDDSLRKSSKDFDGVKKAANDFVEWTNDIPKEQDECDVKFRLPSQRNKHRK